MARICSTKSDIVYTRKIVETGFRQSLFYIFSELKVSFVAKSREEWGKNMTPTQMANLNVYSEMTPEERHRFHSAGGKASADARRRRKTLRETLLTMLEDPNVQDDICLALIREATKGNNAGSVRGAFETLRDSIGEKPRDSLEIGNLDDKPLETIDLSKLSDAELRAMLAKRKQRNEEECGTDVVQDD